LGSVADTGDGIAANAVRDYNVGGRSRKTCYGDSTVIGGVNKVRWNGWQFDGWQSPETRTPARCAAKIIDGCNRKIIVGEFIGVRQHGRVAHEGDVRKGVVVLAYFIHVPLQSNP